jgi:hypothetical protein
MECDIDVVKILVAYYRFTTNKTILQDTRILP